MNKIFVIILSLNISLFLNAQSVDPGIISPSREDLARNREEVDKNLDKLKMEMFDPQGPIVCPGLPGPICIFGERAFPLIVVKNDPLAAAATYQKGRVVIVGHNGFFEEDALKAKTVKKDDAKTVESEFTKSFIVKSIIWANNSDKLPIVLTYGFPGFSKSMKNTALSIREVTDENWIPEKCENTVLIVNPSSINNNDIIPLQKYVMLGGGLITGVPGWGWRQTHRNKPLSVMPMNRVLAPMGIAFADGTIEKPKSGTVTFALPPPYVNTNAAIKRLEDWLAGGDTPNGYEPALIQAAISRIQGALPEEIAKPMRERITTAMAGANSHIPVPSGKKPVREGTEKVLLSISNQMMMQLPPAEMKAHPAAKEFPGLVSVEAKRITRTLTLDLSSQGYICDGVGVSAKADIWHSTGLYAAPGEAITITTNAIRQKLGVRIGSHTDTLWHLKSWQRAPEISNHFNIVEKNTIAANPFGGLIYITVPPGTAISEIECTIAGAVEVPYFQAGKTTPQQWSGERKHAGPWAEFASKKIILTIPSELARTVDDPGEVLAFWDKVLDCDADLTVVPRERGRAERLVHDVQISAGYMHSGYPIMCPLGEAKRAVDVARIQREGAWGYFHELGHNHQQREWTFDGTVEVTCNLYSLYCLEKLCPNAPLHESIRPDAIRRHALKYFQDGKKFETWKSDPFLALIMYKQLKDEFGWESFTKAFAAYHDKKLRPRGDNAKHDEWLVQMSLATGRNLGPFFERWGIPVSDSAKKKVGELKAWMPPEIK